MSDIVRLHGEPHEIMQKLLPWYAMGQLGADEAAQVEAHLADCLQCQAELRAERALRNDVANLPIEIERGWAALRQRIQAPLANDAPDEVGVAAIQAMVRPRGVGWLLGGQAAAILALGLVIAVPQLNGTAQYQALGASSASNTGNIIMILRPETSERELRIMLNDSGARLVDGPTSAGGYVLRVPDTDRGAALAELRAQENVVLAEPIDASGRP